MRLDLCYPWVPVCHRFSVPFFPPAYFGPGFESLFFGHWFSAPLFILLFTFDSRRLFISSISASLPYRGLDWTPYVSTSVSTDVADLESDVSALQLILGSSKASRNERAADIVQISSDISLLRQAENVDDNGCASASAQALGDGDTDDVVSGDAEATWMTVLPRTGNAASYVQATIQQAQQTIATAVRQYGLTCDSLASGASFRPITSIVA